MHNNQNSGPFAFPDHVPAALRWDNSLRTFAHELDDPFLAVSRLHDGPDMFYARDASQERPGWVVTRHALQQEIFLDPAHFSSHGGSGLDKLLGSDFRLIPIDVDPPEQTAFRMIINPFFTPNEVAKMDEAVRATCHRLIAQFENKGGCEFIEDFAAPFPSYIFLSLIGLPVEEAEKFLAWEAQLLRGADFQKRAEAGIAVFQYLQGFLAEQRKKPTNALLSGFINAEIKGRPITDTEILGILYTFYVGGLDTVYSTLGWIMRQLACDPGLQQRLRENLDLLPDAVEEFGRAFSVVSTQRRVVEDMEFHGVPLKANDLVLLPLFLSGRDPQAWEKPHEIDLARKPKSLWFANGAHVCAGRFLARREIRIALEEFLTRFKDIRIPDGQHYSFHTSPVYGVDRLPLEWTKA